MKYHQVSSGSRSIVSQKRGLPVLQRLMDGCRSTDDGCWEWQRARTHDGYGLIKVGGKLVYAMRAMWEEGYGPIREGLHVLHSCDNPPCIRPDHLMLGSQRANIQDSLAKGRRPQNRAA